MNYKTAMTEYMDYCKRQRRLSAHTLRSYQDVIGRFWRLMSEEYHATELGDVNKKMVRSYLRFLNDRYAPTSARHHFTVVSGFFSYMNEIDYISSSPFTDVHARIRTPKKIPRTMSLDDVNKILIAAYTGGSELDEVIPQPAGSWEEAEYLVRYARIGHKRCCPGCGDVMLYYRDCTILEFLFNTGIRIQELCNIRLSDFDRDTGTLYIFGKGSKERKCYITQQSVLELFDEYMKYRNMYMKEMGKKHPFIFITKFADQLTTQAARLMIDKYVKIAGITKKITPHVFRHTFASLLLEGGVDLKHIQGYLGHSTINTTQIYLHISDENAKEVLRRNHPRASMQSEKFVSHV